MTEPIYTATNDEIKACTAWHGGQSSMFCAISSTGHLARGTISAGRSDEQWNYDLVCRLSAEIRETVVMADRQGETADVETFTRMLVKIDALEDELRRALPEDDE